MEKILFMNFFCTDKNLSRYLCWFLMYSNKFIFLVILNLLSKQEVLLNIWGLSLTNVKKLRHLNPKLVEFLQSIIIQQKLF